MREPIDLHETSPGNWEARRHFEACNELQQEDFATPRARTRKPRPHPVDDGGLGFVLLIVVIVAVSSLFRLLGISG